MPEIIIQLNRARTAQLQVCANSNLVTLWDRQYLSLATQNAGTNVLLPAHKYPRELDLSIVKDCYCRVVLQTDCFAFETELADVLFHAGARSVIFKKRGRWVSAPAKSAK